MMTPLVLARAIHIGSCLVLASVFPTLLLVLPPACEEPGRHLPVRLTRLAVFSLITALCSGFVWLWLAIAGMNGTSPRESLQPGLFWMVLRETEPGRVWCVRGGLTLLMAALLWETGRRGPVGAGPRWLLAVNAAVAGALNASLAFLGHAGATEGSRLILAGDLLHLMAASIWPAGLVPLVIVLRPLLKSEALPMACEVTRRFSTSSVAAVAALSLSGLSNSWFLVGSFPRLFGTPYGRLLLLKLALFAGMLVLGARNRQRHLESPHRVLRNVWLEIVLGGAVLLVVGLMGITPPADYPAP